ALFVGQAVLAQFALLGLQLVLTVVDAADRRVQRALGRAHRLLDRMDPPPVLISGQELALFGRSADPAIAGPLAALPKAVLPGAVGPQSVLARRQIGAHVRRHSIFGAGLGM